MTICILLMFSGFVVHQEEQLLSQIQFFNPTRVLSADLLSASFVGKSKSIEMVNWFLDLNSPGNRTEILIDCQKKKILATKLKQVIMISNYLNLQTTRFRFQYTQLHSVWKQRVRKLFDSPASLLLRRTPKIQPCYWLDLERCCLSV